MPAHPSPEVVGVRTRETKSARIELRAFPSLKARAEAVAVGNNQSLSDYTHDVLEAAIERAERKRRQAD